jgi:hypothetical protein
MKSKVLFLVSGLLFLGTLASIAVPWHGTAAVNLGFPVNASTTSMQLSGATKGWPVLLALVLLMSAIVFFVAAIIHWLLRDS